jgi:hypothetical protein
MTLSWVELDGALAPAPDGGIRTDAITFKIQPKSPRPEEDP